MVQPKSGFFVAGGTLPAEAGSYVEREADARLFAALKSGQFCYVLNSRQMGKSSLCVRTMKRLEATGVRTAFVDLTKIGGRNVTAEQWYAGILVEIGRSLELRTESLEYWKEHSHLSPVQRLFGAVRDLALAQSDSSVAVFFDEIDATRSLTFGADEFFAAIRECFNRRVHDPAFNRLTFCLLGVAVPSDLINNPTSTPFNVGERIYLKDFSLAEATPLAAGLTHQRPEASQLVNVSTGQSARSDKPEATSHVPPATGNQEPETTNQQLLQRVFHWTGGHPYLTQSLCLAIASDPNIQSPDDVDALVRRDLFEPKSRETNINLADVANRALHAGDAEGEPEKFRADLLSAYERAWKGKPLADDESNRVAALLKLSGLMRPDGNNLVIRNRIYRHVFDRTWVRENMPGQELRRQRRSYWLGVVRTAVIGALVISVISILALYNRRLANRLTQVAAAAQQAQRKAEYQAYVANINAMRTDDVDKNYIDLARLLDETKDSPYRGMEWQYWNAQIHNAQAETSFPTDNGSLAIAPDGKSVALLDSAMRVGGIYSYPDLRPLRDIPSGQPRVGFGYLFGNWVSIELANLHSFRLVDPFSGQIAGAVTIQTGQMFGESGAPDRSAMALAVGVKLGKGGQHVLDMYTVWRGSPFRRATEYPVRGGIYFGAISSEGKFAMLALRPPNSTSFTPLLKIQQFSVVDMAAKREVDRFVVSGSVCTSVSMSNDARFAAAAFQRGRVIVRDVRSHKTVFDATPFSTNVSKPSISGDDRRLLIQGDETVEVYDLATKRLICEQHGASQGALALDGRSFAVVGPGCRVYDVKPMPVTSRHLAEGTVGVAWLDGVNRLILWSDNLSRLIDPDSLQPIPGTSSSGDFTGNTYWRCIPEADGFAIVAVPGGRRLCRLQGVRAPPISMDATPDGSHIAMTDSTLSSLQTFDSRGHLKWTYHGSVLLGCEWSPDGTRVAVSEWAGSLIVLDGRTGRVVRLIDCTDDTKAWRAVFSHRGHRLAWGGDHDVHVVDLDSNGPEVRMTGHSGAINSIVFSPDDSRLLTGAADGTVRLWDPTTGAQVLRLGSGRGSVSSAVFDVDGRRIFAGDDAGNLTVYNLGTQ
ncbi:MAG: AAA-like domain-containing protein [Fimbriimonadaceae bacterium]